MAVAGIVHWKAAEAGPLIEACRKAGFDTEHLEGGGLEVCRAIRSRLPQVVVIDLSRLPSHGREVAGWLRRTNTTRQIPIVFAGGDPEKVEVIRAVLPDALYCDTGKAGLTAMRAIRMATRGDLVTPPDFIERYRGRTAAQKLGLAAGSKVCVINPPRGFPALLGDVPDGVEFLEEAVPITLWFVEELDQLLASLRHIRSAAARSKLWVLWPKGAKNGLTQNSLREATREVGLVDYKICAVDKRWSGMLFTRKSA